MSDDDAQSHGGQTMAGNPWPKKSKRRAAMSKRKPNVMVPTTAILHADGELEVMGGSMREVRESAKHSPGARAILLVEADLRRDAVLRVVLKNAPHLGTGTAALKIRAAVEKMQRGGK